MKFNKSSCATACTVPVSSTLNTLVLSAGTYLAGGLGIFTTTVPHKANGFKASQNMLIAKLGIANKDLQPKLVQPVSNANYTLDGSLAQLLQGLLNNIKNLQDRVEAIEEDYVRSDTPKVKLNISSTPSVPQVGYHIVRIDPADVLK